jgi:NAD(P)H-dependent FMN reductase
MKKLIGLVGSNSEQSTNRQLLQFMSKQYKDLAEIELVEIKHLPLFNKPANYTVMPEVQVIANKIEAADGVIIATPEHDHSPTAALNNALAWLSYKVYPFIDKPVMIVGASYGTLGSSRAQIQLQQLLEAPELKAHVMPSSEYHLPHSLNAFDETNRLVHKDKINELDHLFEDFLQFTEIINQLPKTSKVGPETTTKYIWDTKRKRRDFKMRLVGLVGSNSDKSYNRLLLKFIKKEYSDLFHLEILEIKDIPLFNQENDQTNTAPLQRLSRKIREADGVIIATPEHNKTVPPALKSVIEWLSFNTHPFKGQPVMLVGTSYFDLGTSRAQSHLRQILEAPGVEAFTFPGDEFLLGKASTAFDQNGNLKAQDTVTFLRSTLEKFVHYVKTIKGMEQKPADLPKRNNPQPLTKDVDAQTEAWIQHIVRKANAVEGETYVELNRGILTVDQVNYLFNAMPFEVNYIDKNIQHVYQDKPQDTHPSTDIQKDAEYAMNHLRLGNMDAFRMHVPTDEPNKFMMHHYKAIRDKEGKFAGINKHVRDIQPIIDWYLEETGQELVDDWTEETTHFPVPDNIFSLNTPGQTAPLSDNLAEAASVDGVSAATKQQSR